nr:MAG TPA: hypothetical protein [Caudoviricetes sp.]
MKVFHCHYIFLLNHFYFVVLFFQIQDLPYLYCKLTLILIYLLCLN